MDRLIRDIRIALRGLLRTPAFTVTSTLILAIAIGMAAAMATVVHSVLLAKLPVRDQDRIISLWTTREGGIEIPVDSTVLDRLRRGSRMMSDIAGWEHWGSYFFAIAEGDRPLVLNQARVTGNFFDLVGARPALGRLLHPDDDVTGATHVMVLSFDAWHRVFGGDSSVIGRRLTLGGYDWTYSIVGVAPAGLNYPTGADYWVAEFPLGAPQMDIVARLARGATPATARAEFLSAAQRHDRERSGFTGRSGTVVRSLPDAIVGDVRPILIVLMAAVVLLLVIACANVGGLLLLRASMREREITVRRALGARTADIVRPLLAESGLLGAAGGALGIVCAQVFLSLLLAYAPSQLPQQDVIHLAGVPLGAALAIAVTATVVFGLVPALWPARGHVSRPLRLDARSGSETRERRRVRQMLVASQVALAVLMLAGAGLLVRSLERLERLKLGYEPAHLAVLGLALPVATYHTAPTRTALFENLYARLRTLKGVEALSPVLISPLLGPNVWQWKFQAEGQSVDEYHDAPGVSMEMGGEELFRTLGIPIIRGRGFTAGDRPGAENVAIVSEAVARLFWPGQDVLGKRLRFPFPTGLAGDSAWRTVVGVVGETHFRSLRESTPTLYLPWLQSETQGFFAVRTTRDLASVLPAIRGVIRETDSGVTLWRAQTMDELLARPLAQPRMGAVLLVGFALVALLLSAIGLFGVMASAVRARTRDIGVRMALGATPERVRRDVLTEAFAIVATGAVFGLVVAFATSRLLTGLLFEVSPTDPPALLGALALLLVVAIASAYVPARRATRIDPAQALRTD